VARRIIDLSTQIRTDHFRWKVERETPRSHAAGDFFEATWLAWNVHGFTHMDAGRHFAADGYTTEEIALEQVIGAAAVVDLAGIAPDTAISEQIIAAAGGHVAAGDIVLMRTCWDRVESLDTAEFWTRAPYMTAEACRWLLARGLKAIAFDFPQDQCIRDLVTGARTPAPAECTTHVELLLKGIPMFEYLSNTAALSRERVEFIGLPLKVPAGDGAPARVIAIEED